jgi:hypothetical protein
MPANYLLIYDTQTQLFLTYYSVSLPNCLWGNPLDGVHFADQAAVDAAIAEWNLGEQNRFIGKNPKLH